MRSAATPLADMPGQADSRLRRYLGYNMKRAYYEIQTELSQALKPLGLKVGSFAVLSAIVDSPGLKQSALAQALAIEQANLVQLVDEFEARGLVKRERASTDRRAYALFASRDGIELQRQADAICTKLEAGFLAGCPEEDVARLHKLLQHVEMTLKGRRP